MSTSHINIQKAWQRENAINFVGWRVCRIETQLNWLKPKGENEAGDVAQQ
jgi:hypothetical protein